MQTEGGKENETVFSPNPLSTREVQASAAKTRAALTPLCQAKKTISVAEIENIPVPEAPVFDVHEDISEEKSDKPEEEVEETKIDCEYDTLPILELKQFASKPFLDFGDVKLGEKRTLGLRVSNETILSQELSVEKFPLGKGFSCSITSSKTFEVPSQGEKLLPISWCPEEEGGTRETILFRLNGQHRIMATVYGKSIAKRKKRVRKVFDFEPQMFLSRPSKSKKTSEEDSPVEEVSEEADENKELKSAVAYDIPHDVPEFLVATSTWKAKPLDRRILLAPRGIPETKSKSPTVPVPFEFSKSRNKGLDIKELNDEKQEIDLSKSMPPLVATKKSVAALRNSKRLGASRRTLTLHKEQKATARYKNPTASLFKVNLNPERSLNVFRDEKWMEKQENAFVRWINFVFENRDSGSVENECKSPLPAVKLEQRRKRHNLRRQAASIMQNEETLKLIDKIEEEVNKGTISMRKDSQLHSDLGERQHFVDILLCYNPVWLRIGLETVFNTILSTKGATETQILTRFIQKSFVDNTNVRDEYLVSAGGIYREGHEVGIQQFTLKRFLFLVYFLDMAKSKKIIESDPMLFNRTSPLKSSDEMLMEFARCLLSGEGNFLRHLSYMGYVVEHSQSNLDEYDLHSDNLAVDLRDGVRLVKLVEILTGRQLDNTLRVPAVSRLQKRYNVGLALDALKEDGILLDRDCVRGGCVDVDSIVKGMRERTLNLLWKIIVHYNIPALLDEGDLNKEIHRILKSVKSPDDSIDNDDQADDEDCILYFKSEKIQLLLQWCRAVCSTYGVAVRNFTTSFSDGTVLSLLINYYQPSLLKLCDVKTSGMSIQTPEKMEEALGAKSWAMTFSPTFGDISRTDKQLEGARQNFRTVHEKVVNLGGIPPLLSSFEMINTIPDEKAVVTFVAHLCARLLDLRVETQAAYTIQSAWLSHLARKGYGRKRDAVVRIQAFYRKCQTAAAFNTQVNAATTVQRIWKGYKQFTSYGIRRKAALCIQKYTRRYLAVLETRNERLVSDILQTCLKKYGERCHEVQSRREHGASILLQRTWKMLLNKRTYNSLRSATVSMQAHIKSRQNRRAYMKMRDCAITVQKCVRKALARKSFLDLKRSSILLQRTWKGRTARIVVKRMKAARKIQSYQRMIAQQQAYLGMRRAAQVIQTQYRMISSLRSYSTLRKAAISIQSAFRCASARSEYKRTLAAVVRAQAVARSWSCRCWYNTIRSAAQVLQSNYRRHAAMNLLKEHIAARTIQTFYRMRREVSMYRELGSSAMKIQNWWRMRACLKTFQQVKNATVIFQKYTLSWLYRREYQRNISAVISLQSWWKMHTQRKVYENIGQAVVTLQKNFRCASNRRNFLEQREAVQLIQKNWRCNKKRKEFLQLKSAALKIQTVFRCSSVRNQFLRIKNSALKLQSVSRMLIARNQFCGLKAACVLAQSHYRGRLARESYRHYRAARAIQATFRGYRGRCEFIGLRKVVVCMQSLSRMNVQHKDFIGKKAASLKIQSFVRSFLARSHFLECVSNVTKCQSLIRAWLCKLNYTRTIKATITMQSYVRRWLSLKTFQNIRKSIVLIQASVRRRAAMVHYRRIVMATKIQSFWRARVMAHRFATLKSATIALQKYARGKIASHQYTQMRQSAIRIQSLVKCWNVHARYLRERAAVTTIAKNMKMYISVRKYVAIRKAVCSIQGAYRRMVIRRVENRQKAATTIQNAFRAFRDTVYMNERSSSILALQFWFRGMIQRIRFLKLRNAVVAIQKSFIFRKSERAKATHLLQRVARGFLGRLTAWKLASSYVTIQACWRGHCVRKRDGKKLRGMRRRIRAVNAKVQEHMKLGNRTSHALSALLNSKQLALVMKACSSLDVTTRLSTECRKRFVAVDAVGVIFGLIKSCNRSQPHIELLKHALNILNNLSKEERTSQSVFECEDSVDILMELLQTFRDKEAVFFKTILIVHHLAVVPERATAMKYITDRLSSILSILDRKIEMEKKFQSRMGGTAKTSFDRIVKCAESARKLLIRLQEA